MGTIINPEVIIVYGEESKKFFDEVAVLISDNMLSSCYVYVDNFYVNECNGMYLSKVVNVYCDDNVKYRDTQHGFLLADFNMQRRFGVINEYGILCLQNEYSSEREGIQIWVS